MTVQGWPRQPPRASNRQRCVRWWIPTTMPPSGSGLRSPAATCRGCCGWGDPTNDGMARVGGREEGIVGSKHKARGRGGGEVQEKLLQSSAYKAAMSAQARKRRLEIQREKNSYHSLSSSSSSLFFRAHKMHRLR